jgi:cytochrome c oxidase cbb3-type subunit 3
MTAMRLVLLVVLSVVLFACGREERDTREQTAPGQTKPAVRQSDNRLGDTKPVPVSGSYDQSAYAISEGKRLFSSFNCSGCHAHGGGSMGPALMDDKWIYGSEPENIFATIVEGRPNGMPSFGGRIPDQQVWQLVAYVRSLSGLVPKTNASTRGDHMNERIPQQPPDAPPPQSSSTPPSAEQ